MAKGGNDASNEMASLGYERTVKRETPIAAFLQIIVAVAAAGGLLYWYSGHVKVKENVAKLRTEAFEAQAGDDAPALLKAKGLYEQIPQYGVAIEEDDRALVQMAELTAQLYSAYGMAEMRDEANKWINKAKEKDLQKAERYAAEAYLMIGDNNAAGAEAMLRDLTDNKGVRHGKILHALSVANTELGKYKEARAASEAGMKLTAGLARLPIAQGDALLAMANYGSARAAYKRALQLNGNHLSARSSILLSQAVSGNGAPDLLHKEAQKLLGEASTQTEGAKVPRVEAFIHYADGEVFLREGKDKQALAKADEALGIFPKLHRAHTLKGRALARMGKKQIPAAQAEFAKALEAAPTNVAYAKLAAETLYRAGRAKQGVPLVQSVVDANKKAGDAWVALSIAQARAGMGKEATASAKEAEKILGNAHEWVLFATARALQASGELDKAREKYNEALTESGNQKWPEVFFEMANVRFEEKNYEDAMMLFQEAVKLWEKSGGTLDEVADGMEGIAKSLQASAGKRDKKKKAAAAELFEKAAKYRRGE
jgi:Flp pilus assembly protein TadD